MLDYDEFASRAHNQYLPYVMSFNRPLFRSASINTDELGFRFAHTAAGEPVSVGELGSLQNSTVNLLVGGSAPLGYGASSDEASAASRLAARDPNGTPWLNMAGHIFNSAQELLLYVLHQHRLPKIEHIVIVGGFNALVMARLPELVRGGLPPFFFCGEYYEKFDELVVDNGGTPAQRKLPQWPSETTLVPPIEETVTRGLDETMARLSTWSQLAKGIDAKLTFLLQPLSTWVREPNREETELFSELDRISKFGTWDGLYGDISRPETARIYADQLATGAHKLGVSFGNLVEDLRERPADDWLYVDRAHFTDHGSDVVAAAVHRHLHS